MTTTPRTRTADELADLILTRTRVRVFNPGNPSDYMHGTIAALTNGGMLLNVGHGFVALPADAPVKPWPAKRVRVYRVVGENGVPRWTWCPLFNDLPYRPFRYPFRSWREAMDSALRWLEHTKGLQNLPALPNA
ncbi:hypothetical protein [Nonomuraea sp. JJY05]|uniref:hypothetical protein n=1 Tax=Nonomuraea sp. JJY05 TaxID=3350255 RepID=UPI00373E8137